MSHYEERLQHDLDMLHDKVATMAGRVENALKDAVHALLTGNNQLANQVILGDAPINRAVREVDRLCHAFIARHLPGAGHLRLISSIIRINIQLERIGDYAVTICRESVQLPAPPAGMVGREVELMAEDARSMLNQSVMALNQRNAYMAKSTMAMADQVERSFNAVFEQLVEECRQHAETAKTMFAMLVVFNMLERVSDQAKNICEETVFAVSGEVKDEKVYRVLFLDQSNDCLSQMAETIARKNYPNSGIYASAGKLAVEAIDAEMIAFMDQVGCPLAADASPRTLELVPQELAGNHVIVSLQGPVGDYLEQVPFHSAALEWDIGDAPSGLDQDQSARRYEELYRSITVHLRDLMETLRGEGAD